jgi:hypothetical protein
MAKQEASGAQNFFSGQKRKLKLDKWNPKHNTEGEKRALIEFVMPLTGQRATGHPEFIKNTFANMEKENSPELFAELGGQIDNCSIEFYDLEENKDEIFILNGATLGGFTMAKVADGETHITVLRFNTTVQRTQKLLKFLHDYERTDVWCTFEPTQADIHESSGAKQMRLDKAS